MKEKWISIGKLLAILAVMVDHTNGILYTDQRIAYLSYYSVSLFVLLTGITTYQSYSRSSMSLGKKVLQRTKGIMIPYFGAVMVYYVTMFHSFDLQTVLQTTISFNASGPHYYILLYIQLLLVSPILFTAVEWCENKLSRLVGIFLEILGGGGILAIVIWTTNYTNLLNVYGGGGKLFGGTYLLLFYFGMILSARKEFFKALDAKRLVIGVLIFAGMAYGVWKHMCINGLNWDAKLPFGGGYNPPSVSFSSYAVCIMAIIFCLTGLVERIQIKPIQYFISGLGFLGDHTLYIFLYHRLFLDYILSKYLQMEVGIMKWILYFGVMIGGALVAEVIMKKAAWLIRYSYRNKCVSTDA